MISINDYIEKMFNSFVYVALLIGLCNGDLFPDDTISSIGLEQCHEGCIKKFATDNVSCLQSPECSMCWDECTTNTAINKSIMATWTLSVTSMVRENSLVSATIAWETTNGTPSDCLVTWEVSGGGLIGNLLTQLSNVELSLWPDTKYRIQVTCKNKHTEEISRSLPLTLDTSSALSLNRIDQIIIPTASLMPVTSNLDRILLGRHHYVPNYPGKLIDILKPSLDRYDPYNRFFLKYGSIILGVVAAIIIFVIVIMVFWFTKRKSRINVNEKSPLVDGEIPVNVDDRLTIHV